MSSPAYGLGLDAGGTQTRWALADAGGTLLAEGAEAGVSALQLGSEAGRAALLRTLAGVAAQAGAAGDQARLHAVVAGVTGFGVEDGAALQAHIATAFGVATTAVRAMSDIELACHAAFPAGDGIVVYAGTGSIAACLDANGSLQRAGGRGAVIDDAGGGHWIAREALRQVWRGEDASPGAWQASPLARHVFAAIGGSDWPATRAWVYGATRGELGLLALAVAAAAHDDADPQALALLQQAGRELARLGLAMRQRLGTLPLALAGRVFDLHPAIEAALQAVLPAGTPAKRITLHAHHTAARLAAGAPLP
jgi:N-acetylglucosamine kinase-like BadF-type ATPase